MRTLALAILSFVYGGYVRVVCMLDEKNALLFTRGFIGFFLAPLVAKRRKNLQKFFGEGNLSKEKLQEIERDSQQYIINNTAENARNAQGSLELFKERNVLQGEANLSAALSEGRGVLLLSAHLGSFLNVYGGLSLRGHQITNVSEKNPVPSMEELVDRLRERFKVTSVFVGKGAARIAGKTFRRGGIFCIMIDVAMRPEHTVWLPFGSTYIGLDEGPARLAVRFNVPVVPVTAYTLKPFHSQLAIGPAFPPPTGPNEEEKIKNTLNQWKDWLEREVSEHPDQWWGWWFVDLGTPVNAK